MSSEPIPDAETTPTTHTMKLGHDSSRYSAAAAFEEHFGYEPPDDLLDRAYRAYHYDTKVTEIAGPWGFFKDDVEPLESPSPTVHRDEVFENELDYMTPVAAELVTELLGADVYVTEMPYANNYRTDLAICEIDTEALRKRLQITDGDDRSLAEEWKFLKSYRHLRSSEPMTYDEFTKHGPYSSATTNRRVWNRLEDMGLLVTKGEYATTFNVPIHIKAHAVELKQRDWETAYKQARRAALPKEESDYHAPNRDPKKYGYADQCWVVMDAGHVDKALAHREQFEAGYVGLIGLDEGGAVKLIDPDYGFSPPKRSLDREHLNEKTMEKLDVDEYVDRSSLSRQADLSEVSARAE